MTLALGLLLAAAVPMDFAVDDAGRTFEVAQTASSVEWRVAAPGESFGPRRTLLRTRSPDRSVRAAVAADGGGVIAFQSGVSRRAAGARRWIRRPRTGRPAARRGPGAPRWTSQRSRWRVAAPRSSCGSGIGRTGAGDSRRPCATRAPPRSARRGPCRRCSACRAAPPLRPRSGIRAMLSSPGARRSDRRRGRRCARRASGFARRSGWRPSRVTSLGPRSAPTGPRRSSTAPSAFRCVPATGCACTGRSSGEPFGAAEIVNPGGGVTLGNLTVTPAGRTSRGLDRADRRAGARVRGRTTDAAGCRRHAGSGRRLASAGGGRR